MVVIRSYCSCHTLRCADVTTSTSPVNFFTLAFLLVKSWYYSIIVVEHQRLTN